MKIIVDWGSYYRDKSSVGSISIPYEYEDREFTTINITVSIIFWLTLLVIFV